MRLDGMVLNQERDNLNFYLPLIILETIWNPLKSWTASQDHRTRQFLICCYYHSHVCTIKFTDWHLSDAEIPPPPRYLLTPSRQLPKTVKITQKDGYHPVIIQSPEPHQPSCSSRSRLLAACGCSADCIWCASDPGSIPHSSFVRNRPCTALCIAPIASLCESEEFLKQGTHECDSVHLI